MPYDSREATTIFARQRATLEPSLYFTERTQAAGELFKATVDAAKKVGYDAGHDSQRNATCISHRRKGAVYLVEVDDALKFAEDPQRGPLLDFPLDFDPVLGMFVGKEEDAAAPYVPGVPRPRRNAVAVVAEIICQKIADQAEQKLQAARRA